MFRFFRLISRNIYWFLYTSRLRFACASPTLFLCFTNEWICLPVYQRINQDVSPALCLRLAYVLYTSRLRSAYVSPMNESVCQSTRRSNQDICHLPENPIRISATCQRINQDVSPALCLCFACAQSAPRLRFACDTPSLCLCFTNE